MREHVRFSWNIERIKQSRWHLLPDDTLALRQIRSGVTGCEQQRIEMGKSNLT